MIRPESVGWSTPGVLGTLGGVEVDVEVIPTPESYPLRHAVLRPHQSIAEVVWENDDAPGHGNLRRNRALERRHRRCGDGVPRAGTFRRDRGRGSSARCRERTSTWRLRGMATRPDAQGQGIGSAVLKAVLDHVAAAGGDLLWCNARVSAVAFYERAGFRTWGPEWVIGSIGPHVVMWRPIEPKSA